jgi:DNA end-binding protein Ku
MAERGQSHHSDGVPTTSGLPRSADIFRVMGMLLRYPYEVRNSAEYFDDVQDVKITKDMLDLAKHIVEQKSGHFDPSKFEDHYEAALQELLAKKHNGQPIARIETPSTGNVVNLRDALRASLKRNGTRGAKTAAPSKSVKKPAKTKPAAKRKGKLIALRQVLGLEHEASQRGFRRRRG